MKTTKEYLAKKTTQFKSWAQGLFKKSKDERSIKDQLRDHPYLSIPSSLWDQPDELLKEICNGCGASGKIDFVPDTIWGLSVKAACFVHDYRYWKGSTLKAKKKADSEFLSNTILIIDNEGENGFLNSLRRWRATTYYTAVYEAGFEAFWADKEEDILNVMLGVVYDNHAPMTSFNLDKIATERLGISPHELKKADHKPYLDLMFRSGFLDVTEEEKIVLSLKGAVKANATKLNLDDMRAK